MPTPIYVCTHAHIHKIPYKICIHLKKKIELFYILYDSGDDNNDGNNS